MIIIIPQKFSRDFSLIGFKTGVITNNWIDDTRNQVNQTMNRFFSKYFDVALQSCQLGMRKPDPRIYRLACQRLGIEPSEVHSVLLSIVMYITTQVQAHVLG